MATLRAGLDTAVGNAGIEVQLDGDIGKLIQAGELLAGLIDNPPDSVGDLVSVLGTIDLPSIDGADSLLQSVGSLGDILPAEAGAGLTTALEKIGGLQGVVSGDIPGLIARIADCIQTVQVLLNTELFTTLGGVSATGSAGGSSGGGAGSGSGGGATEPPAPPGAEPPPESGTEPAVEEQRQARIAAVQGVQTVLDTFPDPFDGEALVRFVHAKLTGFKRELIPLHRLPLYDDVVDSLATVLALVDADESALRAHVEGSLSAASNYLQHHTTRSLSALVAQIDQVQVNVDPAGLRAAFDQLLAPLPAIGDAVSAGDLSGVQTQLDAIETALDQLLPRITLINDDVLGAPLAALRQRLEGLPLSMERAAREAVHRLEPPFATAALGSLKQAFEDALGAADIDGTTQRMATLLRGAISGLDALEIDSLSEPLGAVEGALGTAVDELDAALAAVAGETAALFDNVDDALAEIDTAAIQTELENALADLRRQLQVAIDELFAPVRDAIQSALQGIVSAAESLDLDGIRDKLEQVINEIAAVFEDPAVVGAIGDIRAVVDDVVQQVTALSFAPITDEVIKGIEEITETLRNIDTSALDDFARNGIKIAVEVLPIDLSPITNPLIDEFQALIESGPQQFLEQAQSKVDALMAEVQKFSPADLVGDRLSAPYTQFIDQLDAFEPTQLLDPVQDALDNVKDEVRNQLDPVALLAPVQSAFEVATSQLDHLQPTTLVAPLEDGLQTAITTILDVVPDEIITGVLDEIIGQVQHIVDALNVIRGIIARVRAIMDSLADPEPAVRAWLDPLLDRVEALSDAPSLGPILADLNQQVEALSATRLRGRLTASLDPLATGLGSVDPAQLRTALVAAYQRLGASAIAALPPGPAKTQLETQLARLNPLDPVIANLLQSLVALQTDLQTGLGKFDLELANWDIRFLAPGSPLASLQQADLGVDDLKAALRQGIETEIIENLSCMLSMLGAPVRNFVPVIDEIDGAIELLSLTIDDLITGPASLGAIRDRVQALVARVEAINLDFLTEELQQVFDAVKAKLDAVSPAALAAVVQVQFDELLDTLDVSTLLPSAELQAIDDTYQGLVDDLRNLDPSAIIVDSLQQTYDDRILPLIAQLDLSEPLQALVDRLEMLDEELRSEVERTNDAFNNMLEAASF